MTTPPPAEAPNGADRTPTDPDVLYAQAQRVRVLELACIQLGDLAAAADERARSARRELEAAKMSLRQLLEDVDTTGFTLWGEPL